MADAGDDGGPADPGMGGGIPAPAPAAGFADATMREMVRAFSAMGMNFNFQTLTQNVHFSGQPKYFRKWTQDLDRIILSSNVPMAEQSDTYKKVAWSTARGAVAEVITRRAADHPHETWEELKAELKIRFGPTVDSSHASRVLRNQFQKRNESVQSFAERLLDLAEDAYPDEDLASPIIQRQLSDIFVEHLLDSDMSVRIARKEKVTLTENLELAIKEQNLQRKFQVRYDNRPLGQPKRSAQQQRPQQQPQQLQEWSDPRDIEPMEIDSIRHAGYRCYGCFKVGHLRDDCPNKDVQCHRCQQFGHFRTECPNAEVLVAGTPRNWQTPRIQTVAGVRGRGQSRSGNSFRGSSRGRSHQQPYQQPTYQQPRYRQRQDYQNYQQRSHQQTSQNYQPQQYGTFGGQRGHPRSSRRGQRGRGRRGGRGRTSGHTINNMQYDCDEQSRDPEEAARE